MRALRSEGASVVESHAPGVDRRIPADRRSQVVSLHYPERRSGFDRRAPRSNLQRTYLRALKTYRSRPRTLLLVLMLLVTLNAADLLLTVVALENGAVEVNPVMAWLFGINPVVAAVYKLGTLAVVALLIFAMRRYRRVLEVSLALVAGFTTLFGYHVVGVLARL